MESNEDVCSCGHPPPYEEASQVDEGTWDEDKMLDLAEMYWRGHSRFMGTDSVSPKGFPRCLPHTFFKSVDCTVMFLLTFANVTAVETKDSLVLIDTGHSSFAKAIKTKIREFSSKPVHTCIYTHGHVDHVMGILAFEEVDKVNVIAHENLVGRFDRYKLTPGYNAHINNKQFGGNQPWPLTYRYPDTVYKDHLKIEVGGVVMELYHNKGETDDATWVWIPAARIVCAGDFFIWASPNCGNPQKAQRFPREWAVALRKMAALHPTVLLPGHGPPIVGEDHVRQALVETAEFLETICNQTLQGINSGKLLSDIVANLRVDSRYKSRPYLQPVYDDPSFIVHNLWRHYAGWWDQNPAHLRVGNEAEVAREVCALAGGAPALAEKAYELTVDGKYDAASHMIEWAARVQPLNRTIHHRRAFVYKKRVEAETSRMAKGIYFAAQMESEEKLKSAAYYRYEFEKAAIRIAEKYDIIYEGSVLRRRVIDLKERVAKQTTGILAALRITTLILFLINFYLSLPSVSVTMHYPKAKSQDQVQDQVQPEEKKLETSEPVNQEK